ncbi:MAG: MopE-related protein [Nannocystaceae bacterium]
MRHSTYVHAFSLGLLTSLAACPGGTKGTLDDDGDGFDIGLDCDDSDPDVNPGEVEICGDGIDNDCDGVDDVCANDLDGDGFDAIDDCDDMDANVNPDAKEDCFSGVDDNCDGIMTECIGPTLIYEPTSPAPFDPYSAAVFGDRVVFGEPAGGGFAAVADGRALLFELEPGVVDETDAAATSEGAAGQDGAYGLVMNPVGGHLCIGADYEDFGSAADAGKDRCFSETTVRNAAGTMLLGSADYTVTGENASSFTKLEGEADVDGDGNLDLIVYSSQDMMIVYGDGTPWSGNYTVPADADLTLGSCGSSGTGWCGFARALSSDAPQILALSEEGGSADPISLYSLPLPGGPVTPSATTSVSRGNADSATAVEHVSGFAFGDSAAADLTIIDDSGATVAQVLEPASSAFGYWSSTVHDQDGHELLLVSAPQKSLPSVAGTGVVYVFDLTANGLPTDADQAQYVLTPPDGFLDCGWRARGELVTNDDGSSTTVALSCPGYGGAAYVIDYRPPPAPLVGPSHIYATGPGHFVIERWVVDAFTSRMEWLLGLAQTEVVTQGGSVVGWRLHAIAPGSPLHRAGLRTDDVVRKVDGVSVTSPAVVSNLYQSLQGAESLTLGIRRGGNNKQLSYSIVP